MSNVSRLILICFLICTASGCENKGALKNEVIHLEMTYIAWGCDCANWATLADIKHYSNMPGDSLVYMSVFIEPAAESLVLPDTLDYSNNLIRFTGSFYERRGVPENYSSIENPDKARVFRYTAFQVLGSNSGAAKKLKEEHP